MPGLITLAGLTMEPLHRLSTQELSAQTQPAPFPHGKEREREGKRRLAGRLYSPAAALRWPLLSQSPVSQVCKALTQRDRFPTPTTTTHPFSLPPTRLLTRPFCSPSAAAVSSQFSAAEDESPRSRCLSASACILNEFSSVCALCMQRRTAPRLLPTVSEVIIVLLLRSRSISPHWGAALGGSAILNHTAARANTLHTHTRTRYLCVCVFAARFYL